MILAIWNSHLLKDLKKWDILSKKFRFREKSFKKNTARITKPTRNIKKDLIWWRLGSSKNN